MAKVIGISSEFFRTGKLARNLIFKVWKGIAVVGVKPRYVYRNSPTQATNRKKFAEAVHAWQALDIMTQYLWRALAYGKDCSGYEYFISKYMEDR